MQYDAVLVNKSFMSDNGRMIIRWCERSCRTVFSHRLSSIPYSSCDIETYCFLCMHNGSVNTSFGVEDGLQLLQMMAYGSWYESTSICKVVRA